jgi:predicted esterase
MKEHRFTVEKTTRFYTLGEVEKASKLLIVLHGYGQLPQFFIRKFQSLVDKGYFIVAPEGLHRFYLEGTSGRVGASWMTREARLDDIRDNLNYIKELTTQFLSQKQFEKTILLGFSQGGATATRLYAQFPELFEKCILWASVFPDDVPFPTISKVNKYQFVVGINDPYFTVDSIREITTEYQQKGIETFTFEGVHTIDDTLLNELL